MRGTDQRSGSLFSYVDIEARVRKEHPLRGVCELVNGALSKLDKRFGELYSKDGRPSIAPERLLRASLLQVFYSIRSERQLMERMDFDLLFRWFVGLGIDDLVWTIRFFPKTAIVADQRDCPRFSRCVASGALHMYAKRTAIFLQSKQIARYSKRGKLAAQTGLASESVR